MIKLSALPGAARASPVSTTIISMSTISAEAASEIVDVKNTADDLGGLAKKLAA